MSLHDHTPSLNQSTMLWIDCIVWTHLWIEMHCLSTHYNNLFNFCCFLKLNKIIIPYEFIYFQQNKRHNFAWLRGLHMCICYKLMPWYAHEHNIKEMKKFQRIFFFSKKVFKCHSCNPATDMQKKSESKHSHNILVLVVQLCSSISSSLKANMVNKRSIKILLKFELRIQVQTNMHAYCFRR